MCNEYFQPGFTIPAADGASITNGQNILYFIFKQRSAGGEKKLRAGETISHPIIFSQDLQFLTADGASISTDSGRGNPFRCGGAPRSG